MAMQLPEKFRDLPFAEDIRKFVEEQVQAALAKAGAGERPQSEYLDSSSGFSRGGVIVEQKADFEQAPGNRGNFARTLVDRSCASAIVRACRKIRRPLAGLKSLAGRSKRFSAREFVDEFAEKAVRSKAGLKALDEAERIREADGEAVSGKMSVVVGMGDGAKPVTLATWDSIESRWIRDSDEKDLGNRDFKALDLVSQDELLKGPGEMKSINLVQGSESMELPNTAEAIKDALSGIVSESGQDNPRIVAGADFEDLAREFTKKAFHEMSDSLNAASWQHDNYGSEGYYAQTNISYSLDNGMGVACGSRLMHFHEREGIHDELQESLCDASQIALLDALKRKDMDVRVNGYTTHIDKGWFKIMRDPNNSNSRPMVRIDYDEIRYEGRASVWENDEIFNGMKKYLDRQVDAQNHYSVTLETTIDYRFRDGQCEFLISRDPHFRDPHYNNRHYGGAIAKVRAQEREVLSFPVESFDDFQKAFSQVTARCYGMPADKYAPQAMEEFSQRAGMAMSA